MAKLIVTYDPNNGVIYPSDEIDEVVESMLEMRKRSGDDKVQYSVRSPDIIDKLQQAYDEGHIPVGKLQFKFNVHR